MANFNDMQMIFIDKNAANRSTHWWDRFVLAQWNFDVNPSFTG